MAHHDLLVVGGGTGNNVAAAGADAGLDTALIEPGPLGGTCLNRGCNPSKMLIQAAIAADDVRDADRFHIAADLDHIDYESVIDDMDDTLSALATGMDESYQTKPNLTMYREEATFVDERTVKLSDKTVSADKVVVAAGSRPLVPPIDGLDDVDYLTSREALYLRDLPESMVVMGGGYIAVELGYFFDAMGTDVTIVEMQESLVPREDPDVAATFTEIVHDRHEVYTGHRVTAVEETAEGVVVRAETENGASASITGERLLVALGRHPNTDTLNVDAGGIETDDNGFIVTNDRLETTADGVWAQGDIADNAMFKHSGDYETEINIENVVSEGDATADFSAMPHTIFTEPQMAGVGQTQAELDKSETEYVIGRADLPETPMGRAKKLDHGFVKVLATPDGEILGCHMLGHEVSTMIHEVVVALRAGSGHVSDITNTIHAHPTLNKAVEYAFDDVPV